MADDFFFNFEPTRGLSLQQFTELRSTLLPLRLCLARRRSGPALDRRRVLLQRLLPKVRRLQVKAGKAWFKQVKALHSRWRRRQEQFYLEHRPPTRIALPVRCRGCKPAFFPTSGKRYYCRLSVCPYCHARSVYAWFKRLAYVLNQHEFAGTLVFRKVKYAQPLLDKEGNLEAAVNLAKKDAKYFWRKSNADAALTFIQLLPGRSKHDATVVVHQLLYYVTAVTLDENVVTVLQDIELNTLQRLVCRVLRYPPAWFYRSPRYTLRVFTVLRDRNLITGNGLFYRNNKEEIDGFDLRTIKPIFKKADRRKLGDTEG